MVFICGTFLSSSRVSVLSKGSTVQPCRMIEWLKQFNISCKITSVGSNFSMSSAGPAVRYKALADIWRVFKFVFSHPHSYNVALDGLNLVLEMLMFLEQGQGCWLNLTKVLNLKTVAIILKRVLYNLKPWWWSQSPCKESPLLEYSPLVLHHTHPVMELVW